MYCSVFRKETVMWNYGKMPAVSLKSFKKVNGYEILQLPLEPENNDHLLMSPQDISSFKMHRSLEKKGNDGHF